MRSEFIGVCSETWREIWAPLRDEEDVPEDKVQEAIKNLYKFTNSYPTIRHAGTPTTALRVIDMRDFVAGSILLTGFTLYLSDAINADHVYRGA